MTNKSNNWERLEELLKWLGISVNQFTRRLNMPRVENLYHIKRGNYGISLELADRICEAYPEVDRTWLLSGVGTMCLKDKDNAERRPYYHQYVEDAIMKLDELKPAGKAVMPYITGYDFVMRSASRAMCDKQCAVNDLFLRRVELSDVVQGNEYVILVDGEAIWCKVRLVCKSAQWRLVSRNRLDFPDRYIDSAKVEKAWRVVARLAVMTS
ncbi:MAG: helix-turn-helix transcriptional regulator [Alistipes sp.]|nr:helix-turn-helix transcriptional regulator [Alistipes sp.]